MDNCSLKKDDVEILNVWLGGRMWDASDLSACCLTNDHLLAYLYPFTGKGDIGECRRVLRKAGRYIKGALDKNTPLALFLITTWKVVEFAQKRKLNRPYKQGSPFLASLIPKSKWIFSYLIIMDGGKYYLPVETGPYTENEKMAHKLGGVFLDYNTDAPTAGGRRLAEFIQRIIGWDLNSNLFPNYDFETVKKMAWHIKRENFNADSQKPGSIPKYDFDNKGRPIFDACLE